MKAKTLLAHFLTLVLLLLATGCNMPTQTPTPEIPFLHPGGGFIPITLAMFADDFNDNDLNAPTPPWAAGNNARAYHDLICSGSDCFLRFVGPDADLEHYTGLQHYLGNAYEGIRPNYITYKVFSWSGLYNKVGYFLLQGKPDPGAQGSYRWGISAFLQGQHLVVNNVAIDVPYDWEAQWSKIEFRNITWDSDPRVFDLYLDEALVASCIPFYDDVGSFQILQLYNYEDGYVGFDNIYMGIGIGDAAYQAPDCTQALPPPPPDEPPIPEIEVPTDTPVPPVVCQGMDQGTCTIHTLQCKWVIPPPSSFQMAYCTNR